MTARTGVEVVMLVAEHADAGRHLMVAVSVDPQLAPRLRAATRELLDGQGLWCGPGAATPRCRAGLVELAVAGGVRADVVEAAGFDDPTEARAGCLSVVVELADAAGAHRVVMVRDDDCAATDVAGSVELVRAVGASPDLRCCHADAETDPLTVLAELLAWCWAAGGPARQSAASALVGVHLV